MKYVLIFIFLLPTLSRAQSSVTGIGNYVIGVTTPDALRPSDFTEKGESYVKGTIALPCTHIRTFTAANTVIMGMSIQKAVLIFYDNTLFKISCDLSDSLSSAFVTHHGPGIRKTMTSAQLCTRETREPLQQWTTVWTNGDVLALMVYRSGYGADCKPDKSARLLIASQRMSALSSECDTEPADPFPEEFDRVRKDGQKTQRTLKKNP